MDTLYQATAEYYDRGMAPFEMKPLIAERLKRFASWSGYEEELGRHISLAVLEVEQAMFE
jgi:hypothetical protein